MKHKGVLVGFLLALLSIGSMGVGRYGPYYGVKIDDQAVNGLLGAPNSLAYKVHEIEKHFHSRERWFGINGDQSGNNWAAYNLIPFIAISGNNGYGSDADDEAKVFGTDDTPVISGSVKFDLHRMLIIDADHTTVYRLRIVYGTGTMADAITAGQYTEIMVKYDHALFGGGGVPTEIQMPRLNSGSDKVWIQAWSPADNSQIDFFIGIHEYEG